MGRGMLTYCITFPTACAIQEFYDKKNLGKLIFSIVRLLTLKLCDFLADINWRKCARYSFYGVFISAPILYGWVKLVTKIWPKRSLSTAVQKAIIEQVSFGPTAISLFFFSMALCENNFDFYLARDELKRKFWDAYKVCMPLCQ